MKSEDTSFGDKLYWGDVTEDMLFNLFLPLFESNNSLPYSSSSSSANSRPANGDVPGAAHLVLPHQMQEITQSWFTDRASPAVTPMWIFNDLLGKIKQRIETDEGRRYSFTPEHYIDADNCVTWLSRLLDQLKNDWLNDLDMCRNWLISCKGIDSGQCGEYNVKKLGRISCTHVYTYAADQARQNNSQRFFKHD